MMEMETKVLEERPLRLMSVELDAATYMDDRQYSDEALRALSDRVAEVVHNHLRDAKQELLAVGVDFAWDEA